MGSGSRAVAPRPGHTGRVDVTQAEWDNAGRSRTALVVTTADASLHPERLLLAVHGSNQTPARFRSFTARSLDRRAAAGTGTVVYPQSWRRGLWNDARRSTVSRARQDGVDDVGFLRRIVERYRDRGVRQVVALGYSNGGQLVIRALRDAPDLLDGAILVGATLAGRRQPDRGDGLSRGPFRWSWYTARGTRSSRTPAALRVCSAFGRAGRWSPSPPRPVPGWRTAGMHADPTVDVLPHLRRSGTTTVRRTFSEPGHPTVAAATVEGGGHTVPSPGDRRRHITGRTSPDLDLLDEVERIL